MTDIYQIKIGFRAHNSMLGLNFNNFIEANQAWAMLEEAKDGLRPVEIADNCGGKISVRPSDIMFVMFTDMTAEAKMNEVMQLNQARNEVHLRTAATNDPGLKAAATVANLQNGLRTQ